jgi:hypothetical protein
VVVSEQSFFVQRSEGHGEAPVPEPGELERAAGWAHSLVEVSTTSV